MINYQNMSVYLLNGDIIIEKKINNKKNKKKIKLASKAILLDDLECNLINN